MDVVRPDLCGQFCPTMCSLSNFFVDNFTSVIFSRSLKFITTLERRSLGCGCIMKEYYRGNRWIISL